ncbi:NAD(P)H-binding protein [Nonlabens ponticola]|uniref:NAD-dependent dehydratase n=1 Tax=Nonlabens ponticola TaxID=2496866 RepID=A0A3S9MYB3_9FLAO|nr:NAD(P)H-binding protein [Nonlabens ponticola]AZQ44137.1 NAD-dependent dehydratase [Nonlabens ponticola]
MNITLASSLGNIGQPLAQQLQEQGHDLTIISHSPARASQIEDLGATPMIGSLQDVDFLVSAFAKAESVFLMCPPDYQQPDIREYYRKTAAVYAKAIELTAVKRVVLLSSFGAHLSYGTGPILGSYFTEQIISAIPNIELTILRPTYFYYNLMHNIDMIKYTGKIMANYGSKSFPLVSPRDIATVASQELVKEQSSIFKYIASSHHTGKEIAATLGAAIGKPDLKWEIIDDAAVKKGMIDNGIPESIAQLYTEMYQSLENGRLNQDYDNHKPKQLGKVGLADFAKDFAMAYNK